MNSMTPQDLEADIGAKLDAGDMRGAASAAVRGYGPQILGYLQGLTGGDHSTADELFAQFCEDLWNGLPRFRRECPLRVWAYRVAYSALLRYRKDAFRRRVRPLDTGELSGVAAEVRSQTRSFLRSEAQERLAKLRAQLTDMEQTLLVLRVDRKLSWREIATVLASDEGESEGEAVFASASSESPRSCARSLTGRRRDDTRGGARRRVRSPGFRRRGRITGRDRHFPS